MPKSSKPDESGFMDSLKGIRKLEFDRVDLNQQKPKKKPQLDNAFSARPGLQRELLESGSANAVADDQWFHHGIQKKMQRKIRMGVLNIDAVLDLHGYRQHQAIRQLDRYLQQALQEQLRFILIIHGKGYRSESEAKLRPLVHKWLQQQADVLAYCPAQVRDGGNGATYVYLRAG